MRGRPCYSCRSVNLSRALRLTDEEAAASMVERSLEPLEQYPGGVEIPWRSRCMLGETVLSPGPTLHNIRSGQGGCPTCAERRINLAKPGYLNIVEHDEYVALKWGIANIDQRISRHVAQGWRPCCLLEFDLKRDAWEFERQVKSWVRNPGFPAAVSAAQMKYRGHTETVLTNDVSIMELQATSLVLSAASHRFRLLSKLRQEISGRASGLLASARISGEVQSVLGLARRPERRTGLVGLVPEVVLVCL